MRPELYHPSLQNLKPGHDAFYRGMRADLIREEDLVKSAILLEDRSVRSSIIPAYLGTLQKLSVAPEHSNKKDVQQGWGILRDYFGSRDVRHFLNSYGVTPVVYGSLQYNDPHNLDFDVMLLGGREFSDFDVINSSANFAYDLNTQWVTKAEGHVSYLPLWLTREEAETIARGEKYDHIYESVADLEFLFCSIAVALSGTALFPKEDTSTLARLKREYSSLLKIDPLLPALVAVELQEAIEIRQERRK